MVLSEGLARDQPLNSEKLLTDLGVELPRLGNHNIPKKAPHEKFYWSKFTIWFTILTFKYIITIHIKSPFLLINRLFIAELDAFSKLWINKYMFDLFIYLSLNIK